MKCIEVKKLLKLYVNNGLALNVSTQVEKHLKKCRACSKEISSLKTYKVEPGKLEGVHVPEDSPQKSYKYPGRPSGFDKIVHTLFVPLRKKVTLELAAFAAAVIVIIFVFDVTRPLKQIENMTPESEPVLTVRSTPKPVKIAREEEGTEPEADRILQKTPPLVITEKPLEKPFEAAPGEKDTEQKAANGEPTASTPISEEKLPDDSFEPVLKTQVDVPEADSTVQKTLPPDKEKKTFAIQFGSSSKAGGSESAVGSSATVPPPSMRIKIPLELTLLTKQNFNDIFSNVKDLIEHEGGKLLATAHDQKTDLPLSVTARIPSENYKRFLEQLNRFGELAKPLPSSGEDTGSVWVHINFTICEL